MVANVYDLARNFSLLTNRCIFLTGKAGTGKTTFLRQLREETKKQMVVAAPTGIAAIHAGGVTLHSLFQLPLGPFIPTEENAKTLIANNKMRADRRKILYELELLVIDEVSMLRADVLDALDVLLRHFRYKRNVPFGGVQLILIGDLYQLSPVVHGDEWRVLASYYNGVYFFQSKVWQQISPVYIELDTIFRQKNEDFIEILNQVRNNCLSSHNLQKLNALYNPNFVGSDNDFHVTLTTHNQKADTINAVELAKIKSESSMFAAKVQGDFAEKNFPTDSNLELKVGARVMFVKNDDSNPRLFYNGQLGKIEKIEDEVIYVSSGEQLIEVTPMAWRNLRYTVDEKSKKIDEEMIGSFVQYPLRLAWAVTIHKSQGLTFDKVVIDAERAFAAGQVYVALSRCRELDGIVLLSPINAHSLSNAQEILAHEQLKPPVSELVRLFEISELNYQIQLYSSIFDFQPMVELLARMQHFSKQHAASLNSETFPFIDELFAKTKELSAIGDKFSHQLSTILLSTEGVNRAYLQERFFAASNYFEGLIAHLIALLKKCPISTDVKATAKELNDMLESISAAMNLKICLMQGMKLEPNVLNYFLSKQLFKNTPLAVNTFAATKTQVLEKTEHPELFRQLLALRNRLAKEGNFPLYVIGSTSMLVDISNRLPQKKAELLAIKGFGKAKFERFGREVLEMVVAYTIQYNVEMPAIDFDAEPDEVSMSKKKDKKPKKEKGESQRVSFALYKEGKTVAEIATERQLAVSTIAKHLCDFVDAGELSLTEFISPQKCEEALGVFTDPAYTETRYQLLRGVLSEVEYAFFFHWYHDLPK